MWGSEIVGQLLQCRRDTRQLGVAIAVLAGDLDDERQEALERRAGVGVVRADDEVDQLAGRPAPIDAGAQGLLARGRLRGQLGQHAFDVEAGAAARLVEASAAAAAEVELVPVEDGGVSVAAQRDRRQRRLRRGRGSRGVRGLHEWGSPRRVVYARRAPRRRRAATRASLRPVARSVCARGRPSREVCAANARVTAVAIGAASCNGIGRARTASARGADQPLSCRSSRPASPSR